MQALFLMLSISIIIHMCENLCTQMKVNIFREGEKTHRGRWVGDALTCVWYLGCVCQSMYKKITC